MSKSLKMVLILFFLVQIFVASNFNLAHDEAYYWMFSKRLDWGFFDHPPMVALIIKIFQFFPHSELGVRIGFILLQLGTLLVLLNTVDLNFRKISTLLFLSFPLASAIGLFALPDTPLLFFSALYCLALKRYLIKDSIKNIFLLAFIIPALFYSKYHGLFLVFWTMVALPKLFLRKTFYLVFLISLILFSPHLWWQYKYDFITFQYHFVDRPSSIVSFNKILEYLGSQIFMAGLFVGPICWKVLLFKSSKDDFEKALKFIVWGSLIFFFISLFSKKFEANWTIYLTVPIILFVSNHKIWEKKVVLNFAIFSLVVVFITRFLLLDSVGIFKIKRLTEFHGWDRWAKDLQRKCSKKIVANTYQIASKLSFYLKEEIHSANYQSRKNQFDLWNLAPISPSELVCFVTSNDDFGGEKIMTPDGKNLFIIQNMNYNEVLEKKNKI